MVDGLGRADGDRHRVCGRADCHDGQTGSVELRVFLTAAAIVDDIGAIIVVAIFYSGELRLNYLAGAAAITGLLALVNRSGIYRASPYIFLGMRALGLCTCQRHPCDPGGRLLALFIPTRPPPNLRALMLQADAILTAETKRGKEVMRYGPSEHSLEALDAIHDRLESPADRMLRHVAPRSSYVVLPLFALVNAGVAVETGHSAGHDGSCSVPQSALVVGKPLGFVARRIAGRPAGHRNQTCAYSWRQLAGAGALAGIGFTMSLFIASQAFPVETDFAAVKIAIFAGSILSAIIGGDIVECAVRCRLTLRRMDGA